MEKSKRRVSFWTSLSTKISLIMLLCITFAVSITSYGFLSRAKQTMISMNMNYAQTMAGDYSRTLDAAVNSGYPLTPQMLSNMVGGVQMLGVQSSYIFVTDSQGTILYHPNESIIGSKATVEVIHDIVAGNIKESSGAKVYTYEGIEKLCGYYVSPNGYIIAMAADLEESMSDYNNTASTLNFINAMNMFFFTALSFVVCKLFLRTVPMIVDVVKETADFDFRKSPILEKLSKRKDELGLISRSVMAMRANLRDIITKIDVSAETLTGSVEEFKQDALNINAMCTDNSATTQELAAGMEETSATTDTINGNIITMLSNAKDIDQLAVDGENLSATVSKRAKELKAVTIESTKKTEGIYASVKQKAEIAIENAQIVSKINEMTKQIMQISSQTSLLALNASIEAARAGDSGRGFAVVATEIGNLATQSAQTVKDIDAMVAEVVASVNQMQECLEETTTFIGTNVVADYKEFEKVSDQYDSDAGDFKESMAAIRIGISNLNDTIDVVADSISGINTTITEAARGVTGIAGNTGDIAVKTDGTAQKANDCKDEITNLYDIVSKFTLA